MTVYTKKGAICVPVNTDEYDRMLATRDMYQRISSLETQVKQLMDELNGRTRNTTTA